MHRIEQIERSLDELAVGALCSLIAEHGDQGQKAKQFYGNTNTKEPDFGAKEKQDAESHKSQQFFVRQPPGQSQHGNDQNAVSAVVRVQPFRRTEERKDHRILPDTPESLHAEDHPISQQKRDHYAVALPVEPVIQRKIKRKLGKQDAKGKPGCVFFRISGIVGPFHQQKAVNGKSDPPKDAQSIIDIQNHIRPGHILFQVIQLIYQGRANMVDQHRQTGEDLQSLL